MSSRTSKRCCGSTPNVYHNHIHRGPHSTDASAYQDCDNTMSHGHFDGNDARVARPHRSENPNFTRGSASDAGMCRQLLNIRVIRIPTVVSMLRPGLPEPPNYVRR
jgi:hypothetical protein